MDNEGYRPRLVIILVFIIVVGQILSINYLKSDFEAKLAQCYEAINTNSVMQGALVNLLVKKTGLSRDELMDEAQALSADLKTMMEQYKMAEQQAGAQPEPQPPK